VKQNLTPGIVLIAALAACGVGWLILPLLQDAQRTVDAEAAVHLERARRLLEQYSHGLMYKSLLLDPLAESGVDVDIEDPGELIEVAEDEYQEKHGELWKAYQPYDYDYRHPNPPGPASASYGNLIRQIQEGIRGRDELISENEDLLDEALGAVDQALSITAGDASSASYAEANRLKGVILYHIGLADRLFADVLRRAADPYRGELIAVGMRAAAAASVEKTAPDGGINEQIGFLQDKAAEAEAKLADDQKTLQQLNQTISDLETRLSAAQKRRDQARQALQTIQREGIDFSNPNAAEEFGARLLEQDRVYREASREAKSLEYGTYPNAEIESTGDYLSGSYVENGSTTDLTVEHGLVHYRYELAVLAAGLREGHRALDDLRSDVARLEGIKNAHQADRDRVLQLAEEAKTNAPDVYAELNRIDSEAFAVEDDALELFERSIRASQRAAGAAREWATDARDATHGLSQNAKEQSAYTPRLEPGWMEGHIAAQMADARLARAWIYYRRYQTYTQNAKILADVAESLQLTEADRDAESIKASDAHDQGVDEISQAMKILERAHRDGERHWTFVAQQAGANHMLALFGHPEYIDDAIQAYDNAIKGREDEKFSEKFATRRDYLMRLKGR